ncbi:MAG: redox-sensing transcriptional repressor Rex [Spirochaetales bacterium]|nr:MAG: redox-sensing transcriptional repressor Rex [Spirochaetales bacterium]
MKAVIPVPSVERLCKMYQLLQRLGSGKACISSSDLGQRLSIPPHTIRKDIGFLPSVVSSAAGYAVKDLYLAIQKVFGFKDLQKACIAGLGNLGASILAYPAFPENGYIIAAGFDIRMNRIELLETSIPLYPFYQMPEVVRNKGITLAILTVPGTAAQAAAEKLADAGIRGILNFSPVVLNLGGTVCVQNISVVEELRILSALISLEE